MFEASVIKIHAESSWKQYISLTINLQKNHLAGIRREICTDQTKGEVKNLDGLVYSLAFQSTRCQLLESYGLLVDYCDVFISSLDCHSYVMLNISKSVLMKKQTNLNFGWPAGWITFQLIFIFGVNFSFKWMSALWLSPIIWPGLSIILISPSF